MILGQLEVLVNGEKKASSVFGDENMPAKRRIDRGCDVRRVHELDVTRSIDYVGSADLLQFGRQHVDGG